MRTNTPRAMPATMRRSDPVSAGLSPLALAAASASRIDLSSGTPGAGPDEGVAASAGGGGGWVVVVVGGLVVVVVGLGGLVVVVVGGFVVVVVGAVVVVVGPGAVVVVVGPGAVVAVVGGALASSTMITPDMPPPPGAPW